MKSLRVLMISILVALGTAAPIVVALTPAEPIETPIMRVAVEPTDTPTPRPPGGPIGCPGGGC